MIDAINELLAQLDGRPTDEIISALVTPHLAVIVNAATDEEMQARILEGVIESMRIMLPEVRDAIKLAQTIN